MDSTRRAESPPDASPGTPGCSPSRPARSPAGRSDRPSWRGEHALQLIQHRSALEQVHHSASLRAGHGSPQASARRKRLTAKNHTVERIATSSNARSQGAGRTQPTIRARAAGGWRGGGAHVPGAGPGLVGAPSRGRRRPARRTAVSGEVGGTSESRPEASVRRALLRSNRAWIFLSEKRSAIGAVVDSQEYAATGTRSSSSTIPMATAGSSRNARSRVTVDGSPAGRGGTHVVPPTPSRAWMPGVRVWSTRGFYAGPVRNGGVP